MILYNDGNPSVSVILPTFNRAYLLKRSIDSVINQNFKEWELLVIDDGSADDTAHIAAEYMNRYPNIRYMKHSHRKLPMTLNAGIYASCGDYIAFLGSDDEFDADYLKERHEYMTNNPGIDLIHGGVKIIGDPFVKDKNDPSKKIHLSECVIGGTFFGKRSLFLAAGGFKDLEYSEDSEFMERVSPEFKVEKLDLAPYIYYRDTPDSICNTI